MERVTGGKSPEKLAMLCRKVQAVAASCWLRKLMSEFSLNFSAAVASRQFLISLQKYQEKSKDVLSLLLPRLCLNRYYLAEGVRIYSQETWILTVGQNGKSLVEDNIEHFVKYYIECTQVSKV